MHVTAISTVIAALYNSYPMLLIMQSMMFFANGHTGPSGTVKLAKKEPAAKPAAASAKEKKPIGRVHTLACTLVTIHD